MSQNINSLLLKHFAEGTGEASYYLRSKLPEISVILNNLFSTRSEIHRIQISEDLAERILSLTDFKDIIPLRSEIATLEIKRLISYKKQTDHTAHTIYLFLLGIFLYDNLPYVRTILNNHIKSSKPVRMFIFHWTFASLLHDVGYLFNEHQGSKEVFDNMFRLEFIQNYSGELTPLSQSVLQKIIGNSCFEHQEDSIYENKTKLELLEDLNSIPWLKFLGNHTNSGLEILESNKEIGKGLSEFAYHMATFGYNGKPVADHGVFGGLMLLKYCSFWYFICEKTNNEFPLLRKELTTKFKYSIPILIKHIIPACRAVAYHNMSGVKFNLMEEPLLYC